MPDAEPRRRPHLRVRILLTDEVVSSGAATMTYRVVNNSQWPVTFAPDFVFEEWVGDDLWQVTFPPNWVFPPLRFRLDPGKTGDELAARLPPSGLPPGEYRIVKRFEILDPSPCSGSPRLPTNASSYSEFTVVAPYPDWR